MIVKVWSKQPWLSKNHLRQPTGPWPWRSFFLPPSILLDRFAALFPSSGASRLRVKSCWEAGRLLQPERQNSRPTWANRWRSAFPRHEELWALQARQAGEPNNMRGSIPVNKPMSEANSLTGFQGLKRTLMSEEGVTVFSLSGLWNALWNKARLVCKFYDEGVNPEGQTLQTNKEKMWAFKRMPYFLLFFQIK